MYQRILLLACGELPEPWQLNKIRRLTQGTDSRVRIALFGLTNPVLSHFFATDPHVESLQAALTQNLETQMEPLLEPYGEFNTQFEIINQPLCEQSLAEAIARFGPDLIIKRCRRHHRLDQYLLGHMDWSLIRQAEVPVLLLRPSPWPESPRIVAAIDPLHAHQQPPGLDLAVVAGADRLAQRIDATTELLHVYQPLPMAVVVDDALMLDYSKLQRRMKGEHQQAMVQFIEQHCADAPSFNGLETLLKGETVHEIATYCQRRSIAIIALGSAHHQGLHRLFVGGTTEELIEQAAGDLLVIPTPHSPLFAGNTGAV